MANKRKQITVEVTFECSGKREIATAFEQSFKLRSNVDLISTTVRLEKCIEVPSKVNMKARSLGELKRIFRAVIKIAGLKIVKGPEKPDEVGLRGSTYGPSVYLAFGDNRPQLYFFLKNDRITCDDMQHISFKFNMALAEPSILERLASAIRHYNSMPKITCSACSQDWGAHRYNCSKHSRHNVKADFGLL